MEMAKYILNIFRTQPMIVFSWGFHNAHALPNGLRFCVDGFKYTGIVDVIYNIGADLFNVVLSGNNTMVEDVYLDNLVEVIDNLVEKTCNYKHRVEEEYAL